MKEFLKKKDNVAEKFFGISVICYLIYFLTKFLFIYDTSLYWFGHYFESQCQGLIFPIFSLFYFLRNKETAKYIIIITGLGILLSFILNFDEYSLKRILHTTIPYLLVLVVFEAMDVWNIKKISISKNISFVCAIIILIVGWYGWYSYSDMNVEEKIVQYSSNISVFSFFAGLLIHHYNNYVGISEKSISLKTKLNKSKFNDIEKLQKLGIISEKEAEQRKNALLDEITAEDVIENTVD